MSHHISVLKVGRFRELVTECCTDIAIDTEFPDTFLLLTLEIFVISISGDFQALIADNFGILCGKLETNLTRIQIKYCISCTLLYTNLTTKLWISKHQFSIYYLTAILF